MHISLSAAACTLALACALATAVSLSASSAQSGLQSQPGGVPGDPVATLVGRLDLERYKATIKGLTQFGDRRQGTDRNRAAIDWIEAQLKSYGCSNTERIHYEYQPPSGGRGRGPGLGEKGNPAGGRIRGERGPTAANNDADLQPDTRLRELNSQPSTPGA